MSDLSPGRGPGASVLRGFTSPDPPLQLVAFTIGQGQLG